MCQGKITDVEFAQKVELEGDVREIIRLTNAAFAAELSDIWIFACLHRAFERIKKQKRVKHTGIANG